MALHRTIRRTFDNDFPTQVNPNKKEHWSGLSQYERTWNGQDNRDVIPKYVVSRRDMDGRQPVARTHNQRYKDLRAALNVK